MKVLYTMEDKVYRDNIYQWRMVRKIWKP